MMKVVFITYCYKSKKYFLVRVRGNLSRGSEPVVVPRQSSIQMCRKSGRNVWIVGTSDAWIVDLSKFFTLESNKAIYNTLNSMEINKTGTTIPTFVSRRSTTSLKP